MSTTEKELTKSESCCTSASADKAKAEEAILKANAQKAVEKQQSEEKKQVKGSCGCG